MSTDHSQAVWNRLLVILTRHLRSVDPDRVVPPDLPLVDLGLDSMAAINLLLDIEDGFGISFPDDLLNPETFSTGGTLCNAITNVLSMTAPQA